MLERNGKGCKVDEVVKTDERFCYGCKHLICKCDGNLNYIYYCDFLGQNLGKEWLMHKYEPKPLWDDCCEVEAPNARSYKRTALLKAVAEAARDFQENLCTIEPRVCYPITQDYADCGAVQGKGCPYKRLRRALAVLAVLEEAEE